MSVLNLTEQNIVLLKAIVEVAKSDIDFAKVAELAEMKAAKYARDQWAIVRKKIIGVTKEGGPDGTPKKTKETPSRKRKTADVTNTTDDDNEATTPKGRKKARASPVKGRAKSEGPTSTSAEEIIKGEPNEAGEMMDMITSA